MDNIKNLLNVELREDQIKRAKIIKVSSILFIVYPLFSGLNISIISSPEAVPV